jgi:hypothetical protein
LREHGGGPTRLTRMPTVSNDVVAAGKGLGNQSPVGGKRVLDAAISKAQTQGERLRL